MTSTRTRVTFLDHSASLSGAELFLAGMLERTEAIEATVVLFEDGPLRARLEAAGVVVRLCPLPGDLAAVTADGRGPSGNVLGRVAGLPGFLSRLRTTLRESSPEVVYTNSAKAHVLGGPIARSLRLPVVMHAHDLLDEGSFSRPNLMLLRRAARRATHVIANSEATQATLPAGASSTVVHCPTPAPPTPAPGAPREFSVAVVGRIADWKGQHVAVAALEQMRRTRPEATLHLYGTAAFGKDREYDEQLDRLIAEHGLAGAVVRHGHVSDVSAAMRTHSVVAHTSVRPEPFGQVVVEALAAGVPVVAADAGGPREILRHEESGLLYAAGDAAALATALMRIEADPALRERLVAGGSKRAEDFGYPRLLPIWESVLTQPTTKSARSGISARRSG